MFATAYVESLIGASASGVSTPRTLRHAQSQTPVPKLKSEQKQGVTATQFDDMDMDEYCTDFSESDDVRSIASVSDASLPELSDGSASSDSELVDDEDDKDTLVVTVTLPAESEEAATVAMDVDSSAVPTKEKGRATVSIQAVEPETEAPPAIVQHGAHRTWQALVLYLYNDHVGFAPLRTEGRAQGSVDGQACSPKSMYRLADKVCRSLNRSSVVRLISTFITVRAGRTQGTIEGSPALAPVGGERGAGAFLRFHVAPPGDHEHGTRRLPRPCVPPAGAAGAW